MPKEQNITYDDFEQSLQQDGIQIYVPKEDDELPEGIGASGYKARKTAPSATNPYYLKNGYGGYNRCILISGKSCLANCVGYAFGRTLEIGTKTANSKLPTCNAEDWLSTAKANGFKTGNTPKLGAVVVWKSGQLWNGKDGCGHVGVVEEIYSNGSILVSQSNYGGTRFFLTTIKKPYNITGQTFIGFIYNPYYVGRDQWREDGTGWWYEHADGSYSVNSWEKIDGKWYHFDDRGYMQTGWIKDDGKWYYLKYDGAMASSEWVQYKNEWYYLGSDGAMLENSWLKYENEWYYLGKDGAMLTGKHKVSVSFDKNGAFIGN